MNNEFQEYVIDMLLSAFKMCKEKNISEDVFCSPGSKHTLKAGLINHYPSMYKHQGSFVNLWQNSRIELCEHLLMSENAYNIIQKVKSPKYNGSYSVYKKEHKNKANLLYWEHITPNDIVWKRICKLYHNDFSEDVLRQKIKDCFYAHKLLLLTTAEAKDLDTKGGRTGQNITTICNRDDFISANVAEERISCLFEKCKVKHLYFNSTTPLEKSDVLDENNNFIGEIKKYFTDDFFIIS